MWKKELDPEYIKFEKDVGAEVEGERIGGRTQWYETQKKYWDG